MSPFDLIIVGIGDSLNPCNLSVGVFFAAFLGWARKRKMSCTRLGWGFVFVFFLASFAFSVGFLMNILYSTPFFNFGRILYVGIGLVFMLAASVHFWDWLKTTRKTGVIIYPLMDDGKTKPLYELIGFLMVFVLSTALAAAATVWPPNKLVSFYANYLAVPGKEKESLLMLTVYHFFMAVPVALAMLWIPLTSPGGFFDKAPSKAKIITSAFLFALGFCLVYIFR